MSKRNQMPGLRRKGDIWHIEKRCKHAPGGWLRESTGTASRAEAERRLICRLAEIEDDAEKRVAAVHTFEDAAMRYLEVIAHKPSASNAAMHIDRLLPFIGRLPLHQIHDATVRGYVQHEEDRGLAPRSINSGLGVISAVLNKAARVWRDETGTPWLKQAPAQLTRLPLKGKQAKPYPLSWEEQDRLFAELPDHLGSAALFAVNTGCREQEVCQLRWDWEVAVPQLDTSVFLLPSEFTKTSVERVVVLNSIAEQVVESQRGEHPERVFSYRGRGLSKLRTSGWVRAWERAELPMQKGILKGVHNLRHTAGRRLRSAGVPLETRKALLGHSNGDITTHYSAAELGELMRAAEKLVDRSETDSPTLIVLKRSRSQAPRSSNCRKTVGSASAPR